MTLRMIRGFCESWISTEATVAIVNWWRKLRSLVWFLGHVDEAHFLCFPGILWLDILDILTATARRTEWRCPRVAERMRELDTESPVVWPAWCYSGESRFAWCCFIWRKNFVYWLNRSCKLEFLSICLFRGNSWHFKDNVKWYWHVESWWISFDLM